MLAAIVVAVLPGRDAGRLRWLALASASFSLAVAVAVVIGFDPGGVGPQMLTSWSWLGTRDASTPDIRFALGIDGISLWLVALTALLVVPSVLVSWEAVTERPRPFYALLLALESGMLGVFTAQDIVLFYVFFEFTLIPLFFLIGLWGGPDRRLAARKFFIYTLAGSVLTLVGLLYLVAAHYDQTRAAGEPTLTFSIPVLLEHAAAGKFRLDPNVQWWVFLALCAGFAIKVPLFPFHTWLPLAHVEAPTAGSVLLAGVLLKIGTYGFVRFSLPLLPAGSMAAVGLVTGLAVVGILYGALTALGQSDIKRLVAYSSVSHLGFCMLGLFALNHTGIDGGLLQMVNHGLSTGGLFVIVGMLYERYHTREIAAIGGIARKMPVLTFFMLVITLSSIGLPGLNGFIGEFLILVGAFEMNRRTAALAAIGIVLGAYYMLWLVQRMFFGDLREPPADDPHRPPITDLKPREIAALAPIAAVCLWIGVYPNYFLDRMKPAVDQVVAAVERGRTPVRAAVAVAMPARPVPAPSVELHPTLRDPGGSLP
jgi:NADH-quinone oxidoreductase subunit M